MLYNEIIFKEVIYMTSIIKVNEKAYLPYGIKKTRPYIGTWSENFYQLFPTVKDRIVKFGLCADYITVKKSNNTCGVEYGEIETIYKIKDRSPILFKKFGFRKTGYRGIPVSKWLFKMMIKSYYPHLADDIRD